MERELQIGEWNNRKVKGLSALANPQLRAVMLSRWSRKSYRRGWKWWSKVLWNLNITLHGTEISPQADLGPGFRIMHSVGVVIGKGARAGSHLTVYQNVTIGAKGDPSDHSSYPRIGDNVTLYAGCIVMGNIRIGSHVQVGANSVVLKDVPDYAIVAGVPAQIIGYANRQASKHNVARSSGNNVLLKKDF